MMDQTAARPFSAADFRQRAAAQSPAEAGDSFGDHRFNPGHPRLRLKETALRDAAVLIPVVDRGAEATVLLTKRAETLRNHTGQVAFPGGRIDAEDASPEAAALREAEEEVSLDPAFVEVVGRMPDYVSGSGYRIAPILSVEPGMGDSVLILAFVVIVIGGIGSMRGAFIAALLIGLVDTLGRSFMIDILRLVMPPSPARTVGPAIASMLIYVLMALVLYFRPAGLFPAKGRS